MSHPLRCRPTERRKENQDWPTVLLFFHQILISPPADLISSFPLLLNLFLPVASLQRSPFLTTGICVQQTPGQLHSHHCFYKYTQQPSEQQHKHQQAHRSCQLSSGIPHPTLHFLLRKMTEKAKYHSREKTEQTQYFSVHILI